MFLIPEGVVEPAVEERVAAGGRHGDHMAAGDGVVKHVLLRHRRSQKLS
jgi:hypothetical protein